MPKIKDNSGKPPTPPPRGLKEKIDLFAICPEEELASNLAAFTRWDYPKGDLHQWIAPLNRFDDIFEKAIKDHGFREELRIQKLPFDPALKELLCQIMRVTALLFGQCSYRTIYDVLENALRLVACFAARTAQRPDPSNSNFRIPTNRLWKFAAGEAINSRQPPFPDLKSLLSSQVVIPPNWAGYHFHYYKRPPSSPLSSAVIPPRSAANTQVSPLTPAPKSRDGGESSQKGQDTNGSSDGKMAEGWIRLHISPDNIRKRDIYQTYQDLVVQANIPKDDQFRLFVQVLQAAYYQTTARREQFLRCQLYAVLSLANVCDGNTLERQLYNARPEFLQQLVRLLHSDSEAGINLKTIVLKTLRTLARNSIYVTNRRSEHSRFQQILNALDSNLNHGILMTLLRENVIFLQSKDPSVEEMQYTQALHRLVREFLESQQGASNLGFAGIIPILVDILKIERPIVWNIVVTIADLLGALLPHQRHNQLLPLFIDADGYGVVIRTIKRHVDYNIATKPQEEGLHNSLLTFPEHQTLHTFLHLLLRLVKTGHAERVRSVVDSEVIRSLREILDDDILFGGYIPMFASKLLAVIIHNEPTSYAALHENGLPQAFCRMLANGIQPSTDLISAIPNVFDAICINAQGRELFLEDGFEGFFSIFKSIDHCKVMGKGHCASDAGAGMDELLRHHPELKDRFLSAFHQMLEVVTEKIIQLQEPTGPKLPELFKMDPSMTSDETQWLPSRLEEEKNIPVLIFARSILSFSEGFFSTGHWVKEFVKDNGHIILLSILNAPSIPYDFCETRDGLSLRNLLVQFVDQSGQTVVIPLLNATKDILSEIESCKVSLPVVNFTDPTNAGAFEMAEVNQLFRLYSRLQSHLAVLQSIYMHTPNMQGRTVAPNTPSFASENLEILGSIGNIVRDFYFRGNRLLRSLPKKYRDALPLEQLDGNGRRRSDKPEIPDEVFLKKHGFPRQDAAFRNVEMVQYFISFLPKKALKFFAGLSISLAPRLKMTDLSQRAMALAVADRIADVFLDLLSHVHSSPPDHTVEVHLYWLFVFSFIHSVLNGGTDPGQPSFEKSVQTLLLNRFYLKGGLAAILRIVQSLAQTLPLLNKDDPSELLLAVPANLKKAFTLIRLFTIDSPIAESPQTALLTSRERNKDQGHYFLLSSFITETRATCLPVLADLLSLLGKLEKLTAQPLLSLLCDLVLGGPEEFYTDANKYDGDPDEGIIQRLCQHGFDRTHVYSALVAHGNVEAAALTYLLSRRNIMPVPNVTAGSQSLPQPLTESPNESGDVPEGDSLSPWHGPQPSTDSLHPVPSEFPMESMDVDSPSLEGTSSGAAKDKGKESIETPAEALARLRTTFGENLENYITDILVYHPDLPFELSRLIKAVGKWESSEWLQEKMLELAARLASLEDDKATKGKEITACAHVLGLLLSEPRYYTAAEPGIIGFLDSFVSFLTVQNDMEAPWISSIAFIIEVIMREVEWRQCKKRHDPSPANTEYPDIDPDFYVRLLDKLIEILKVETDDETALVCVLRLLVRLTREGQYARLFREKNGIQSLLQLNHRHAGKTNFKISDSSIIIIRHVVEDDKIVLATMRSAVQMVLDVGANRGRHIDLSELLRNKYAEVLRNPELFKLAVEQIAKLTGWSSSSPNSHKLCKKPETPTEDTTKAEGEETIKENKLVTPETPKKSTLELNYSSGVVQILLTELLSHHTDTAPPAKKDDTALNASNSLPSNGPSETPNGNSNQVPRTKLEPEEMKDYAYTLFLLQTLSELVGCYNNCKLEFVNYSRRGQPWEPLTPSKPRSMMLNYLLNDLLPTGSVSYAAHSSHDMDLEKKRGISALVISVTASLCKRTMESYEHNDRPDLLLNVRKFVLEGIARSIKETLGSLGPAQLRYSKYTALAELCRKLLSSQPIQQMQVETTNGSQMAKLMFEKGFIGLLTSVVADVELDFPDVRVVVNEILASLKDLTVSINRLAADSSIDAGRATGDIDEISTASSISDEDIQDRDETPDVFRNSALGIHHGVVEDNGHINHHHHHHHDFAEYDEMDYDDEDDDEDDDDDLDESGSEDDEMDEVGDDMNVHSVEIIMEDERDGRHGGSENSSDLSDSDGMDDDEGEEDEEDDDGHEEDGEGASENNSMIDMLEEEQMEADEVEEAEGWTTDTDSADENEEIDEEDESNDNEFGGFPPPPIPVLDEDVDLLDYSGEELDERGDFDAFREMLGNLEGQAFDPMAEEEEDDHQHIGHPPPFALSSAFEQALRRTGIIARHPPFNDTRRTAAQRSVFPTPLAATTSIHPMMVNIQSQPQRRPSRGGSRQFPPITGAPPDLLRSMEHLFGMHNVLSDLMEQLGDGHGHTISFELRSQPVAPGVVTRIWRTRRPFGVDQNVPQDVPQHPLRMATDIAFVETSTRWQQAANMWFQNTAADKAVIFEHSIFKLLEPAAIEEEKTRKAKEEADQKARKAKEEEELRIKQKEEEARARAELEERERKDREEREREEREQADRERLAAEALIQSSNAPGPDGAVAMDGVETSEPAPAPLSEAGEAQAESEADIPPVAEGSSTERIYTTLRGGPVDITGLGVDPEFLEALPEEMREEVLYQHIRDRRAAAPPDQPSTLDRSFLEALPPEIREELLEEEAAERRRQERTAQRQQGGQTGGAADLDPASFIASLEGPLRTAVLLDQDDEFLSQLPPHIVAEANALRERVGHRFGAPLFSHRHPFATEVRRKPQPQKRKDGIQLLEKAGLATLIRLTFLRNRPDALQDILLELCRHRHTRIEVVVLLLSILQEGSADVAAVERSFAQLSVKAKGDQNISPVKSKMKTDSNFISHISGENSPTLIARHCLELLNHLIRNNHSLAFYFLTEHEWAPALKRVNSKKGKGKEVATKESRYPINALLSLLERSAILETKTSTEEFARLLADVTKPLLSLQRKNAPKPGDKEAESNTVPPPAEDSTTAPQTTTAPSATTDAQEPPANTSADGATADTGGSSSVAPKTETIPPVRTLTPPVISEHNLELLVLILVAKEVSRETFRSTLATMHHLMAVPGALDVFGCGLAREAQRYGDVAQADLWAISHKFQKAQEAGNLKDVDLTEYTSRGADQTKLLKIFKAIDYLFNRVQPDDAEDKEKDDAQATNRQGALAIYSQLSLNALWDNLSLCLGYLRDNSETWALAQTLLPMIESLLVACNHVNTIGSGKRLNTPEAERMESLFFRFTEEHRKILNYLVHMQPSLMSGSFEILAFNPKVLEFDNKRNYFNRKLHDRKGQRVPSRTITLNIRRDMVFLDSFRSLCFRTGEEIKNARLNVRFQGEEGVDAGGLTREWYQVLARQMFDPNYALFTPVASDSATFHPNKSSYVNDEHLNFFKFVGRIIGKALFDGRLLDCHFSRAVYKHILGKAISVKDLEYYDNTYYKNLMWILENPINDIVTEAFSIEAEEYGVTHIIDLVPDGRTIPVTDENKNEYVRLVSEYKLQTSVKDQLKEFLTGFHDIIPSDLVSIFNEQELELLISGLPDIDIEDWKAHSAYTNYDASSPQIQWFWRAVRSFNKEERAKLLQFATGTSKVPLNGFKELEGMQGTTKFTIVRDFGHKNRLPQSHTCFNQIDLPEYDSYEQLRSALLTAITMGTEGFGFA